jgi:hypothetical protein
MDGKTDTYVTLSGGWKTGSEKTTLTMYPQIHTITSITTLDEVIMFHALTHLQAVGGKERNLNLCAL